MKNIENNKLFNDILERNYYINFQNGNKQIEIYLNGICSANCKYCYLKKYQKDLFPNELYNQQNILKNFQLILNWYIKNKFCCEIEIFSGEWLTTNLRKPIFNILYNTFKNVQNYQKPKLIIIPDNMNFIKYQNITNEIQNWINKMKEINIPISISASIDGAKCDYDRTIYDENFYIDCFNFLNKNQYFCHPMISSYNIKDWKENYLWFVDNAPNYITKKLMMLEVRDETWNDKQILQLLDFCNFLIDFKFKNYFNNNLNNFTKHVFGLKNYGERQYSPELIFIQSYFNNQDKIHCMMTNTLHIRAADLTLGICHRLWYDNLILGKFNVENDEITDVESQNVELLAVKAHFKKSCMPHCETCPIEPVCPGFCCGNSYENYGNPLIPTMEVCEMYRAKYSFLIKKYDEMGIFKLIKEDPTLFEGREIEKQYLLDLRNKIINQL